MVMFQAGPIVAGQFRLDGLGEVIGGEIHEAEARRY
jgi:hypothetical protein